MVAQSNGRVLAVSSGICFEMAGEHSQSPVRVFVTAEALSGDVLEPLRSPDQMLAAFAVSRPWIEVAAREMSRERPDRPILIRDVPLEL